MKCWEEDPDIHQATGDTVLAMAILEDTEEGIGVVDHREHVVMQALASSSAAVPMQALNLGVSQYLLLNVDE